MYVFRGITQELDPGFTCSLPAIWGSRWLQARRSSAAPSPTSGTACRRARLDRTVRGAALEEDFYATLGLGFAKSISLGTTFTAYTSPNAGFNTVKELSFKVSQASRFNPYGTIAFELSGQADGGSSEGTYLEIGAGPAFPLKANGPTLTIPIKFGFSLSDYYESGGEDHKFGFFDIGAQIAIPFTSVPSNYGTWNVHGGVDFYAFGDTTKALNDDSSSKVVGLIGIGVSY